MDRMQARKMLEAVADGSMEVSAALAMLQTPDFSDLGYAKVDNTRGLRQGVSEVIYGQGKTGEQICGICRAMLTAGQDRILITRIDAGKARMLEESFAAGEGAGGDRTGGSPEDGDPAATGAVGSREDGGSAVAGAVGSPEGGDSAPAGAEDGTAPAFEYYEQARIAIVGGMPEPMSEGQIAVACAGTSDLPVAEEAALTAEFLGNRVNRLYDVGVAGIHRLLAHAGDIAQASVIVAVAGMEGALPSVVAGLASCPVIAVPTSVGYGASLGGVAALLAMLNSCASGVSVVNIDNGFGAGYQAALINRR